MKFLRLFTKGFFLTVNITAVIFFLVGCLAPFISPARFWPIGFFSLAFPYLFAIMVLFAIFWLIFHPRYALIPVIAMLIGWKSISSFVAFNWPGQTPHADSTVEAFTVMSYNVAQFGLYRDKNSTPTRKAMYEMIQEQEADVLCMQDFYTSEKKGDFNNREDISREMNLPFRYFSSDFNRNGSQHWGSIIFSRYPILKSDKVKLDGGPLGESLIYADILRGADTIRVVNMHLESYRFNRQDYAMIEKIKKQEDTGLVAAKGIMQKMREAYVRRSRQADLVAGFVSSSPHKVIVCGDFNDTPASYTYFTVKGKLQDVFLVKGNGIGRTYASLAPTLRIDYIFADPAFEVHSFRKVEQSGLSDHYPVITRLSVREGPDN